LLESGKPVHASRRARPVSAGFPVPMRSGTARACLGLRNMRHRNGPSCRGLAVLSLTVVAFVACSPTIEPPAPQSLAVAARPSMAALGRLPLAFEPNTGQAPDEVRYVGRGTRYRLWLTPGEARFSAPTVSGTDPATIRLRLVGGAPTPPMTAEDALPGKVHYLVGADPAQWRRDVPTYRRVVYRDVYPGVDLVFHGDQRDVEFDFVLAPGADPRMIGVELDGADTVALDGGDVVARTGTAALRLRQPVVYQEVDGTRRTIPGRFALRGRRIAFEVGAYDRARALVIDPVVHYSTYLGDSGTEVGRAIAVDSSGNAYAVVDGLGVVKLSADGSRLLYTTVLGDAQLLAVAVDAGGHAYVAGNFPKPRSGFVGVYPVTPNALQPTFGQPCNQGDSDGVMAKLSPDGSDLLYSSFVGGRCTYRVSGIAVDPAGRIYVTGDGSTTSGYPATRAPFGPVNTASSFPGWVQVVSADFSRYVYSALILADGGSSVQPTAIAVDRAGNAYLTGTAGPGFPTTPGTLQATAPGGGSFVAKISTDGTRLVYGTYFGGAATQVSALAVDGAGNAYLTGHTGAGLPTANALQATLAGGTDAFVAKLDAAGSALDFSTYLGGRADDAAVGVGLDSAGNVYVAGPTDSTDFPIRNALPTQLGTAGSNFVTALTPAGTALAYSTYFGDGRTSVAALAVAAGGAAYLTGGTTSTALPTVRPMQPGYGGGASDAFLARIDPGTSGGPIRVLVTAPPAGATVSGTAWITVWVQNAAAGSKTYTLGENGATLGTRTTTSDGPVSLPWATTGGANGRRTVTVGVRDAAGNTGSATLTLEVQNAGQLAAAITSPAAGGTVSGVVTVGMAASNASGTPITFTLTVDGGQVFTAAGTATTASFRWDTAGLAPGAHTLALTVRDGAGRTASASRAVDVTRVGGGGGDLAVVITAPAGGATVSGTTWIVAWAEGAAAGGKTFTLLEGGSAVATVTTASSGPVSLAWPTTTGANGSRSVSVTVHDRAGKTGSATGSFNVQNAGGGGGGGALRVAITRPGASSTVRGAVWFTVWVEGAAAGAKTFTLSDRGTTLASTTTSSSGPVSLLWTTAAADNGTHTPSVSVRDAAGRTGMASLALVVAN
jgi:Bacterial Ig domain/Beta-propeller repeat